MHTAIDYINLDIDFVETRCEYVHVHTVAVAATKEVSMPSLPAAPGSCPICGTELLVTRLDCPSCETRLEGRFAQNRFSRLPADHLAFLEVFVRNRGVIKDVEAELGISYPTVRARLDDLLRALYGPSTVDASPTPAPTSRRAVLEAVREGRLSAEQAAAMLATSKSDR